MAAPQLRVCARRLLWRVPPGWRALSSASVGGGLVRPQWVLNVDVGGDFDHTDLGAYVDGMVAELGLCGTGCALLTAADVTQVKHAEVGGVQVWATVGVTRPTWPARQPAGHPAPASTSTAPGTINIVVALPVPLTTSALVQAVGTVTEAKAQALVQAGVPGTGTASDALVVLAPEAPSAGSGQGPGAEAGVPVPFAGVRSPWGERVARAVHATVAEGLRTHPWPAPDVDPRIIW